MRKWIDFDQIESYALRGLLPFQLATVERIDDLFRQGQRRVLVADEVGLGKTLIARGVIAKAARICFDESKNGMDVFTVAYICSNQNIVRQNLDNLQIEKDTDDRCPMEYREDPSESRLSLQSLLVEEKKLAYAETERFIQYLPLTPETSFRMGNNWGRNRERAFICAVLSKMSEFHSCRRAIFNRLCGNPNCSWGELVNKYNERIEEVEKHHSGYLEKLHDKLWRHPGVKVIGTLEPIVEKLLETKDYTDKGRCVLALRRMFADIGAECLNPDLVIMDEFQRFRYMLHSEDTPKTECDILVRRFLSGNGAREPRVLLLSATPFKPYSSKEEVQCEGTEESYEEFRDVLSTLFPDRKRFSQIWNHWSKYAEDLSRFVHGEANESVPPDKSIVEEELRLGMCRTDRDLVGVSAVNTTYEKSRVSVLPNEQEIRAYLALAGLAAKLDGVGLPRIGQMKSVPYLLSFRGNEVYKEQQKFEQAVKKQGNRILKAIQKEWRECLWIDRAKVQWYHKIPFSNTRLELLSEHAFAEARGAIRLDDRNSDRKGNRASKPEFCLWLPPTLPCYPPGGPFAGMGGYSKTLVFSAWEMVPKMIASLLSYESECRTVVRCYNRDRQKGDPPLDYFAENRYLSSGRLNFRMRNNKASAMSLFALLYPSRTLADVFRPNEARNGAWSLSETEEQVRQKVKDLLRKLDTFTTSRSGPVDARWYYLAPMLLDDADKVIDWIKSSTRLFRKGEDDNEEKERSSFENHLKQLENEIYQPNLGKKPSNLVTVLVDIALGSPAVCALRTFNGSSEAATSFAMAFRRHLNSPEAIAALDCSYARSDDAHWRNVLRYGKDGCLSSVLIEWRHLLQADADPPPSNKTIASIMCNAFKVKTTTYSADTFEALSTWVLGHSDNAGEKQWIRFRSHFAAAFNKGVDQESKGVNRRETLRTAFNSPFRPFVLASTSIGQEGLDFHRYCRKVFHWNLPSNPIDFEQREGRVDRFKGLSIRQSLAKNFAKKRDFGRDSDPWKEIFDAARSEAGTAGEKSGLIPFWRTLETDAVPVESIVPVLSFSQDEVTLRRILDLLRICRMAIGQPRQEDLLERVLQENIEFSQIRKFFLDLCPFSHRFPSLDS